MAGLLIRNRKAVLVGRRLALATPGCIARCCNGCPLWQLLALCDTSPSCDGTPPPVLFAWICTTVTCLDGSPLTPGRRVYIDGFCWTVTIQQIVIPPSGDYIITGRDPVQCVSGCDDPVCPPRSLWFPGTPCNPANPVVYFCGITQCGRYRASQAVGGGCYKVDPADGGVPLPPGALTSAAIEGPYIDCCSCEPGCRVCPLVTGSISDPTCFLPLDDQGIPAIFSRTCCRSSRACYRVTRMIGTQTFSPAPFEQPRRITNEWLPGTTNPDGSVSGVMRNTREFDTLPTAVQDYPYTLGGCGLCPSFPILPDREPMSLTFTQGAAYVDECRSFDPSLVVTAFSYRYDCGSMSHNSSYRYDAGGRIITTSFLYEAGIIDDDGGTCEGRCIGRGVSAAKRKSTGGCKECGRAPGL